MTTRSCSPERLVPDPSGELLLLRHVLQEPRWRRRPPGSDGPEPFTRRTFVKRVGAAAAGASFLKLLDGAAPARSAVAAPPLLEQHLDVGDRITTDNGVEIVVPPVYHEIVTGRLVAGHDPATLLAARDQLAHALQSIEAGMARARAACSSRSGGGCRTSASSSRG